jgi:hypothetical protein
MRGWSRKEIIRYEAACERRNVEARERLRGEVRPPTHSRDLRLEQEVAMYTGLLENMDLGELTVALKKAQDGSNRALQTACARELARRRSMDTASEPRPERH